MKKALSVILSVCMLLMIASVSFAEEIVNIDEFFTKSTPADLLNLREQLNEAIHASDVWEEVEVPSGAYHIGEQIPAGIWEVSPSTATIRAEAWAGEKLDSTGMEIDYWNSESYWNFGMVNKSSGLYEKVPYRDNSEEIINLPDGYYFTVNKGSVKFTPYDGNPDFDFYASSLPSGTVEHTLPLSSYDYEQLIKLKDRVNLALWESYSWEKVLVPEGIYQVGKDIPAGKWTITAPDTSRIRVKYDTALEPHQMNMDTSFSSWSTTVCAKNYSYYDPDKSEIRTEVEAKDGGYFILDWGLYGWFAPKNEGASLGFKGLGGGNGSTEADDSNLLLFSLTD